MEEEEEEEEWAVDLAVSKLEEEGEEVIRGGEKRRRFGWRRVRGLNQRHV